MKAENTRQPEAPNTSTTEPHTRLEAESKKRTLPEWERRLLAHGYKKKKVVLSGFEANVLGTLYALPAPAVMALLYWTVLQHRGKVQGIGTLSFYLGLVLLVVTVALLHELLHGVGWALAAKTWNVVQFQMSGLTVSCHCNRPLPLLWYLFGAILPEVVLGIASILLVVFYAGTFSMLAMLISFVGAGGDFIVSWRLLQESPRTLVMEHPTRTGYIAYVKRPKAISQLDS